MRVDARHQQIPWWLGLALLAVTLYFGSRLTWPASPLEERLNQQAIPELEGAFTSDSPAENAADPFGLGRLLIVGGGLLFLWLGWRSLDKRAWTVYVPHGDFVRGEFLPLLYSEERTDPAPAFTGSGQDAARQAYLRRFNIWVAEMVTDRPQAIGSTIQISLGHLPGFPLQEAECQAVVKSSRMIGTSGHWHSLTLRWRPLPEDIKTALLSYIARHRH